MAIVFHQENGLQRCERCSHFVYSMPVFAEYGNDLDYCWCSMRCLKCNKVYVMADPCGCCGKQGCDHCPTCCPYDQPRQALLQLRQFAALRSRRELGWARLAVEHDPEHLHWCRDNSWSRFRSLDDMQCAVYYNSNAETKAHRLRFLECAKNELKRKQRQAGVGRG